jgi:hypothetical protein
MYSVMWGPCFIKQLGFVIYYRYPTLCVVRACVCLDKLVTSVISEACPAGPRGSGTSSQGICGYIFVMATLKFDVLL